MAAATLAALLLAPKRALRACVSVCVHVCTGFACVCAACCFWRKKNRLWRLHFFRLPKLPNWLQVVIAHSCVCVCVCEGLQCWTSI